MSTTKKSKRKQQQSNKKIALFSVLAVVLVAVIVYLVCFINIFHRIGWQFLPSAHAMDGTLSVSTDDGDALSSIPKGEIRYRINKNITFESTYSKGDIMLENPKACEYDLKFSFYLKTTNEKIYTSDLIRPGQYISGDKLNKKLPQGEHECTYVAQAYSNNGEKLEGETTGSLYITIES